MNITDLAQNLAVEAVASRIARLQLLDGKRVLVEVPLYFDAPADGKARHRKVRARATAAGTASDYVLHDGEEVLMWGRVNDDALVIDRTRIAVGDVIDIPLMEVSVG